MREETPQTAPNTVGGPWVMMASRQSVPSSSAARFWATQPTPWPRRVKITNFVLKIMLTGARSAEPTVSSTALAATLQRPPNAAASSLRPRRTTTLANFGRNRSSIVSEKSVSASGIASG